MGSEGPLPMTKPDPAVMKICSISSQSCRCATASASERDRSPIQLSGTRRCERQPQPPTPRTSRRFWRRLHSFLDGRKEERRCHLRSPRGRGWIIGDGDRRDSASRAITCIATTSGLAPDCEIVKIRGVAKSTSFADRPRRRKALSSSRERQERSHKRSSIFQPRDRRSHARM